MASSAVTLPLLDVSDLTIRRESSYVLSKVNWSVRKGEHWVILGANGSGKTSLLKAIAGYMPPTDGDISVLGETFGSSDWRELRKRIGVVSASISHLCHDEDPALEIVAGGLQAMIGLWGQLRPGDEKKALAALGLVRARYLADRRWEVLSQGERQKVLIARALISAPPLLILDEPCSGSIPWLANASSRTCVIWLQNAPLPPSSSSRTISRRCCRNARTCWHSKMVKWNIAVQSPRG